MSTLAQERVADTTQRGVVGALARLEGARLLRSPALWVGVVLTVAFSVASMQFPEDWSGARYTVSPGLVGPLVICASFAVASSFHRERVGLAADAPVGEATRTLGRLTGAVVLIGVAAVLTAVGAMLVRTYGGLDLGDEPGRTLHAQFTAPEILQPVCLTALAVGVGAAAGRRFQHRASAMLALFIGWFPFVGFSWAFQSALVTPFSVVQVQPVSVEVGPVSADPLTFPADWLLSAPGEFQDHWARLFVSARLAAGHDLWLIGLALLFVALALPRGARTWPTVIGGLLAVTGVVCQYLVIP